MLLVEPDIRGTEFERALPGGGLDLHERYRLERVRSAPTARVFRFSVEIGNAERTIYYKEFLNRFVWDVIKHIVRASRARRAFMASAMLASKGFRVPETVALGERRTVFWLRQCFSMTFEVEASEAVYAILSREAGSMKVAELRNRRELIRGLGAIVGRLHREGIVHGDLRLGNVLARCEQGRWQFFFLDNERTRRFSGLPARLRLKNLVQVNMCREGVSSTDRLRFYRAYLSQCPELGPHRKYWAAKVQARTAQRLAERRCPRDGDVNA